MGKQTCCVLSPNCDNHLLVGFCSAIFAAPVIFWTTDKRNVLKMLPSSTRGDSANGRLRHSIFSTQGPPRQSTLSVCDNLLHGCLGQLVRSVLLATLRVMSSLTHHIHSVLPMRSQKQVSGINTGRIIAMVADLFSLVKMAIRKEIGVAMREPTFSVHSDSSIAVLSHLRTSPYPTIIGCADLNLAPKSSFSISPPSRSSLGDFRTTQNLCMRNGTLLYLIRCVRKTKLRLHNQHLWLCHALGCFDTAEAFSLCPESALM